MQRLSATIISNEQDYMPQNGITHQDMLKIANGLFEDEKHEEAFRIYYPLANAKDINVQVKKEAQFKIGQIVEAGIGIEQDYAIALDYYVRAANNGSRQALEKIESMQIDLDYFFSREDIGSGYCIQRLIHVFNNVTSMYSRMNYMDESNKWMTKAAALNSVRSQIEYINYCDQNQFDTTELVEKLLEEAELYSNSEQFEAEYVIYLFLAGLNNARAEYNFGALYLYGEKVAQNVEKGLTWLKRSAEHNDVIAQFILGCCYFYGDGVAKDIKVGLSYFEKAAENINANGSAEAQLGLIYQTADGVVKDDAKALKYYTRGAELGDVCALYRLGCIYFDGTVVDRNVEVALSYFELAAEKENADGFANYKIGMIYLNGNDVDKNVAKALKHLIRAAELGNVEAQFELGCIYLSGIEVSKDVEVALNYFRMAAENENADGVANFELGQMYLNCVDVVKNVVEALEHLIRAAELGNVKAQFSLGALYDNGDEVVRDVKVALSYFRMAAKNKKPDGEAELYIGLIYLDGDGVPKDEVKALKHLKRSVALGDDNARIKLEELLSIQMDLETTACS